MPEEPGESTGGGGVLAGTWRRRATRTCKAEGAAWQRCDARDSMLLGERAGDPKGGSIGCME